MAFTSKLYMLEPSTMSSHLSLVLSLLGRNFPATLSRLQIWQCSARTLSLLIISCPGHTDHYLTPWFYPSLLLTLFYLSLFLLLSSLTILLHTTYKHLNRWKALHLKTESMSATSWEVLHRTGFQFHWGQFQWQFCWCIWPNLISGLLRWIELLNKSYHSLGMQQMSMEVG